LPSPPHAKLLAKPPVALLVKLPIKLFINNVAKTTFRVFRIMALLMQMERARRSGGEASYPTIFADL
jgi:hypothetical protein